jgi:F-type H+-transporting ATPase subunit gamma
MERRTGNRVLMVVITADRGLAGAFNANVVRGAMRRLRDREGKDITLQLVGRKGRDFFRKRPFATRGTQVDLFRKLDYSVSRAIAADLVKAFLEEGYDEVWLLSNRFKSVMTQDLVLEKLLPAGAPQAGEGASSSAPRDYIYEPDPVTLLAAIVQRSIETIVHQALIESYASEMGARMVAMENATRNAADMIERLTLVMNRTRQAAITTEIIEVVSGATALGG